MNKLHNVVSNSGVMTGGLIPSLSFISGKFSKVNLGKKGVYYRLKVGPFKNAARAKSACGKLKRRRQFCEPSTMGAG